MNHRQRQVEFLRQCVLYDNSSESHELADRVQQLNRKQLCVQRRLWLMVLLGGLAFVGLGYQAVFLEGFPGYLPGLVTWFITEVLCVMGLSSLICVAAFVGLGRAYRKELDERCEQCRRLATKLFESRLGNPTTPPPQGFKELQAFEPVVSSRNLDVSHSVVGVMRMPVNDR